MRCSTCIEEGERSTIPAVSVSTMTTLSARYFYDEDGVYHSHDPNRWEGKTRCSRGHLIVVKAENKCLAKGCDFGHDQGLVGAVD